MALLRGRVGTRQVQCLSDVRRAVSCRRLPPSPASGIRRYRRIPDIASPYDRLATRSCLPATPRASGRARDTGTRPTHWRPARDQGGYAISTKDENLKTRPLAEISGSIEKFHTFASVEDSTLCDFCCRIFGKCLSESLCLNHSRRYAMKGVAPPWVALTRLFLKDRVTRVSRQRQPTASPPSSAPPSSPAPPPVAKAPLALAGAGNTLWRKQPPFP